MTSCSICSNSEDSYDSEKSISDGPSISIKKELIQSTSLIKGSTTSSICPPLPKLNLSVNNENSFPPLPALTSHNLKKFNSTSTDDNSKDMSTLLSSSLPYGSRSNPSNETEFPGLDAFDGSMAECHYPSMTKIHNYPLISGSIPAQIGNQAYLNITPSTASKKEAPTFPMNSILSNVASGTKKESGEKNKVKFSDTITVAVVPEISRKEKINNFSEKTKRKSFSSPDFLVDLVKRELKESLPLSHPQDYLKDFLPAPEKSSKEEKKEKPSTSIKVVNFGLL